MADVLHSALTGSDLHETKGADTASVGQVPVANGTGGAPFNNLSYTYITNTPAIPSFSSGGTVVTGTALVKSYLVTASSGTWTQALAGFTTVHAVQATAISATTGLSTACFATVNTVSSTSVSGQVFLISTAALGTTQQVYLTVFGV